MQILTALEEYFLRREQAAVKPCGKTPYTSHEAKNAIRALRSQRRNRGINPERRTYQCPDCGHYHITSHPR